MAANDHEDGYPTSPPDETTPDMPPLRLADADELTEREHGVTPAGSEPDGTASQEDEFNDDEELATVEGIGLIQATPVVPEADAEAGK